MRRTSTAFPALLALAALATAPTACGPSLAGAPARAPAAAQWFDRAKASYKNADFEDASEAAERVVQAGHNPPEPASARSLSARPLLARYRQYSQTT